MNLAKFVSETEAQQRIQILRDEKQKIKNQRKDLRLRFQRIEQELEELYVLYPELKPKPGRPVGWRKYES